MDHETPLVEPKVIYQTHKWLYILYAMHCLIATLFVLVSYSTQFSLMNKLLYFGVVGLIVYLPVFFIAGMDKQQLVFYPEHMEVQTSEGEMIATLHYQSIHHFGLYTQLNHVQTVPNAHRLLGVYLIEDAETEIMLAMYSLDAQAQQQLVTYLEQHNIHLNR